MRLAALKNSVRIERDHGETSACCCSRARAASPAASRSRNASSRRWVAMIVSSRNPPPTRRAAISERPPSRSSSTKPSPWVCTFVTPATPDEQRPRPFAIVDLDVDRARRPDELADGAVGDEAAPVHHEDVAAHLLDLAEVMARQQHRGALRAEATDQLADLADLAGVEAVRRLVEHEKLRPPEQQPREPQPLLHALRVRPDLSIDRRAEVGQRERAVEIGVLHPGAAGLPPQAQIAHAGQVRDERRLLDHRADPDELARARRDAGPEEARRAAGTSLETRQHPQRRRLPGAVRPEQAVDLARVHREREILDRADLAEGLPEALDLDDRIRHTGEAMCRARGTRTRAAPAV